MYIYIHTYAYIHIIRTHQHHKNKLDSVRKIDLSSQEQMALAKQFYARNYECVNFFLAKCVLHRDTQQFT
jgi:hypothetical protein